MNRRFYVAAALLIVPSVVACSKSNEVNVNEGASGGGNNDHGLPECPATTPPATGGPAMVRVGRLDGTCFWMDQTEVSRAQYKLFLDGTPSDVDACKGKNTDFLAMTEVDLAQGELPISGIDWCDAAAYCASVGKTLCGSYDVNGAEVSSFETTCTDGDNAAFNYNALKEEDRCNGGGTTSAVAVGSEKDCVTPTNVFDLVGNVWEWTAECEGGQCMARGGSYSSTGSDWGCKVKRSLVVDYKGIDLGFRCCAEEKAAADGG